MHGLFLGHSPYLWPNPPYEALGQPEHNEACSQDLRMRTVRQSHRATMNAGIPPIPESKLLVSPLGFKVVLSLERDAKSTIVLRA